MFTRRTLLASFATLALLPASRAFAAQPVFYRSPGCGCCEAWTQRMAQAGMPVDLQDSADLQALSTSYGVPQGLAGCHIGKMDGYVISGHVPPDDVKRLLSSKPDALGIVVPGMPAGSPGMEMGGASERFDVLLIGRDGRTSVFASHGAA